MSILARFWRKRQPSTHNDEQVRPIVETVIVHTMIGELSAADWLDLQLLAKGTFLQRDPSRDIAFTGLVNWTVEITTTIERAALERLTARGIARTLGPESRFARLTMRGVGAVERAMRHAQSLQLARA
jgi:hypothetical protein